MNSQFPISSSSPRGLGELMKCQLRYTPEIRREFSDLSVGGVSHFSKLCNNSHIRDAIQYRNRLSSSEFSFSFGILIFCRLKESLVDLL